jgi:3-mercaptopyruvate sulfurtransferase SseA
MPIRGFAAAAIVAAAAFAAVPGLSGRVTLEAGQLAPAAAPRITLQEFKKLFDKGEVIAVDVRGLEAFNQARIPGAVLLPDEAINARAAEFRAADKPVVVYCA